ncbi:ABC transporter permease [Candidatus Fermentibacteria bacterium]|nr:ABC transporter permease [Candidatus Fermentibacteria bacterium]
MKWSSLPKVAVRSLLKNKMRSLLTSLGIIIGVGAVIIMVAIGEGSQVAIAETINSLGTNMIMIRPSFSRMGGVSRGAGSHNRLTMDDAETLKSEATLCRWVSPVVSSGDQVIGGAGNWNTSIMGVDVDYLSIRAWELTSGEFFTERDVRARAKVAVLGKTVADELFPGQDPVGERLRIRNTPFMVIGLLTEKGEDAMGRDEDDVVMAPSTTVFYRLSGGGRIHMIVASAVSPDSLEAAQEQIIGLMRTAHKLAPAEDDDFAVNTQTEIVERASETAQVMTVLLGSIAAVSLLVGGIGIMNIMLVSVTERTREIGIRMSVGGRGSDILLQFLAEAILLSLVGGIIGILLAFGIAYALEHIWHIRTVIDPAMTVLAFSFSGVVGVFFGLYPARKAAALNPIDALRHE